MKIYVDAGHGGSDNGAVQRNEVGLVIRRESVDNLRLALLVQRGLDEMGFETMMSRTGDYNKTLRQRTDEANMWSADFFLSLHRNDFAVNGVQCTNANGFETFIQNHDNKGSRCFQQAIHAALRAAGLISASNLAPDAVPATQMRERGEKFGNYHVTRESRMPAVLVETGFIANAKDNELFDLNIEAFGRAYCDAIADVLYL
jgi:N-acetylmuramoyl-L-alanine amidase